MEFYTFIATWQFIYLVGFSLKLCFIATCQFIYLAGLSLRLFAWNFDSLANFYPLQYLVL